MYHCYSNFTSYGHEYEQQRLMLHPSGSHSYISKKQKTFSEK